MSKIKNYKKVKQNMIKKDRIQKQSNRFSVLLEDFKREKKAPKKKRRQHINFKIQITKKPDISVYINFLENDINKRLQIDKKYVDDYNLCHLKHLNFILMEILLFNVLKLFTVKFNEKSSQKKSIESDILYTPEEQYKKALDKISKQDIEKKYEFINNQVKIQKIANEIYSKYKCFEFINLNFLKRKIYEYI